MFDSVEAFYRPATVREALALLSRGRGSGQIVAGCTDVIAGKGSGRSIRFLIDVTRAGLSYIRPPKPPRRWWAIGATTTMAELEESNAIAALAGGLLAKAAATSGSVEIRNMATVGGNLANGSPAADLAPALLVLDASAAVANARGHRKVPLADYLAAAAAGKMRNTLLVEVTFSCPSQIARCGWSFQKLGRTELDISLVNAAAGLQLDGGGRVEWVRLALGAVAPTAIRLTKVEALMAGRPLDRPLIAEAAEAAMHMVEPISDVRASAEYRREMSRVLTARALLECAVQAGCSL